MTIQAAIAQLQNYNGPDEIKLNPGVSDALLHEVEMAYNITLPDDFKEFYRFCDGFEADKDMFNIISLRDIIENKEEKGETELDIAEYMIYSDTWRLEINPENPDDYIIFIEADYKKLILTTSLGEFIGRFLQGGVFDAGGLYEWHMQIESLPGYQTKVKTAEYLLTAFSFGLRCNLLRMAEVKEWANEIIIHDDEPEFFFIELSLSPNKNDMLTLLNSVCKPVGDVAGRGVMGVLYHRLSNGLLTTDEALAIVNKFDFTELLTHTEAMRLMWFTDEIMFENDVYNNKDELREDLLEFLSHYEALEISNYELWYGLSRQIRSKFRALQRVSTHVSGQEVHVDRRKIHKQSRHISAIFWVVGTVSFIGCLITYNYLSGKAPLSKFCSDLSQVSVLFLCYFIIYGLWRGMRWGLGKIFKF